MYLLGLSSRFKSSIFSPLPHVLRYIFVYKARYTFFTKMSNLITHFCEKVYKYTSVTGNSI